MLPGYRRLPFTTVGDAAFPSRSWLLKAFPDTTKDATEMNFNAKLRSARVVSEHAYGMLTGRWRILYQKTECRRSNITAVIMCCIALHNLCIKRNDPCNPRWKLEVEDLNIIRKATKRTQDRMLAQGIRQKITSWLWSLHGLFRFSFKQCYNHHAIYFMTFAQRVIKLVRALSANYDFFLSLSPTPMHVGVFKPEKKMHISKHSFIAYKEKGLLMFLK